MCASATCTSRTTREGVIDVRSLFRGWEDTGGRGVPFGVAGGPARLTERPIHETRFFGESGRIYFCEAACLLVQERTIISLCLTSSARVTNKPYCRSQGFEIKGWRRRALRKQSVSDLEGTVSAHARAPISMSADPNALLAFKQSNLKERVSAASPDTRPHHRTIRPGRRRRPTPNCRSAHLSFFPADTNDPPSDRAPDVHRPD